MPDLIELPQGGVLMGFWEMLDIDAIMASVHSKRPYYIAGGFLRDKLAGIPFKDIDVFVPGDEPFDPDEPKALRYRLSSVAEVICNGRTINLIGLRNASTLAQVLETMDVGLCQIGMGQDNKVYVTRAYLNDVANNTLTVLYKPEEASDFDHIERLKKKFPDRRLVEAWRVSPADAVPDFYEEAYRQ